MQRTRMFLIALTLLALGGAILLYRAQQPLLPAASADAPAPPVAVQTTHSARRDVARVMLLPGDIAPLYEVTLYAKVAGYLDRIPVDKGDRVQEGQLLAALRAPELDADRDQAQQAYRSALASAEGSEAVQQRSREEEKRAQIVLEKAQADYAQAPATVRKAKAQLQQAQNALQKTKAQQAQADATLAEDQAQVRKAEADRDTALAEQHLAEQTFARYQGIYTTDKRLIARQEVDEQESRARAAESRTAAAQNQVEAAQQRVKSAQAQAQAAASQIAEAEGAVLAAEEQVHIAEAQQASAQKQVDLATQEVGISKQQQQVAQAKTEETRYTAQAGKSAAGRLATVADYTHIRAPFSGVITRRMVDPGAFIQAASTTQSAAAIVTLANMDTLRVYLYIPETEARFVKPGSALTLTSPALGKEILPGRVTRVASALDAKTRTMLAEADIPNRAGKLMPGASASAKLTLETHANVLSVPSGAVVTEKSGKSVFVVEGGKAKKVPITPGFDDGANTEIMQGLEEGQEIVVVGKEALTPGAAVNASPWTPGKAK